MEHGDILLVAGGAYSSKPRPVLVIQNHEIETGESVIVVPFTSTDNADISTRIAVSPSSQNGLDRDCFLEVDKMSAINTSYAGDKIGTLEDSILEEVLSVAVTLISPPK
jgi:mRNA-degrading endonuclease toxin of MazEF toxin-antitoxin module